MVVDSAASTVPADGHPGAGWAIGLTDVARVRSGQRVLEGIDLEIPPGAILAVIGDSGYGATALAGVIAGRERTTLGEVRIDGRARPEAPRVPAVFEDVPARRVRVDDALLPRGLRHDAGAREEMARLLEVVGLDDPHAPLRLLSRGERQRVALARALAAAPRALVLDDALRALHTSARDRTRDTLVGELRRRGTTTVWITQDAAEAAAVADLLLVLHRGRMAALGTPEEVYARAGDPGVAAVIGPIDTVPGIVEGTQVDVWGQLLPLAEPARDGHCEVIVPPGHTRFVGAAARGADAVVERSVFLGSRRHTVVRTEDGRILHVEHALDDHREPHARVRVALVPLPVVTRPLD